MRAVFALASFLVAVPTLGLFGMPALADTPPLAALACGGCHGVGSQGAGPIVALAGRPKQEIVTAMTAFASGERPGTIMGRIARGYTPAEIEAIAAHLSASPAR